MASKAKQKVSTVAKAKPFATVRIWCYPANNVEYDTTAKGQCAKCIKRGHCDQKGRQPGDVHFTAHNTVEAPRESD